MGYNLKVTVTDGKASVGAYGKPPDGQWEIAGQDGQSQAVLSLTRRDPDGRTVQVVTNVNYRESE